MSNRASSGYTQFLTDTGAVVAAGTVEWFENNDTNTQATIYSDADLTVAQSNPYTLDANGQIVGDIFFNDTLTYVLKDSTGATIRQVNDVLGSIPVAAATTTAAGIVELSTDAEAVAGSDSSRAVVPANLIAKASAPGPIGDTTPSTGAFTTLSATGVTTVGDDILTDADSSDDIGTDALRFQTLYVDGIVTESGARVMADAYGLITGATTVDGTGIASVSSGATGVFTVVFDNAASATAKQATVVTAAGTSSLAYTTTYSNTTTVVVREWIDGGAGADTAVNSFPISIIRFIIP